MGNQKQKWTAEEEEALHQGVQKYGAGKWKHILKDPQFSQKLASRSNIDLKDKWRNLNVFPGQNPKTPKGKPSGSSPVPSNATPSPSPAPGTPAASAGTPAAAAAAAPVNVAATPQAQTTIRTPTSQPSQNDDNAAKIYPQYNSLIFEALSTIKDPNGSDLNAIISFIEQKHSLPQSQNFRRTLGAKLRRLVGQGKLEKVQNGYKIKDTSVGVKSADDSKPPAPIEMDLPGSSNNFAYDDAIKEASETLACRLADAENKSFLATAAVRETERYSKFGEENDAMLKIAEEIYAKCMLGETVRFT